MTKKVHEVELSPDLAAQPQYFWIEQKKEVVLFQDGDRVRAFSSICPHMGAQMEVRGKQCDLVCPWHGLKFDCEQGGSNHHRYRHLKEFDVEVRGNKAFISVEE